MDLELNVLLSINLYARRLALLTFMLVVWRSYWRSAEKLLFSVVAVSTEIHTWAVYREAESAEHCLLRHKYPNSFHGSGSLRERGGRILRARGRASSWQWQIVVFHDFKFKESSNIYVAIYLWFSHRSRIWSTIFCTYLLSKKQTLINKTHVSDQQNCHGRT